MLLRRLKIIYTFIVFLLVFSYIQYDPLGLVTRERYDYFSENIVLCSMMHNAQTGQGTEGVGLGLYWPVDTCRRSYSDSMLGIVLKKRDLSEITDASWDGGISKTAPVFLVDRSVYNFQRFKPGRDVYFPDGSRRSILSVLAGAEYLNVQIDGGIIPLDAMKKIKDRFGPVSEDPYLIYTSQIGASAYIGNFLQEITGWTDVNRYRSVQVALTSAVLTLLLIVLFAEFGFIPALAFAIALFLSPWWLDFSKNLYWNSWVWMVPLLIVCRWLSGDLQNNSRNAVCFVIYAVGIFLKSAFGYEYLSTIVLMSVLPVVYVGFRDRESLITVFWRLVIIGLGSMVGFAMSLLVHASLRADTLSEGMKGILVDVSRRTYATGEAVQEALGNGLPLLDIVAKYFGVFYQPIIVGMHQPFYKVLIAIVVFSLIVMFACKGKARSLSFAVLASIAAPLSWIFLAKGHAAMHLHLNPVLWDLPVVPVAVLMVAFAVQQAVVNLYDFNRKRNERKECVSFSV